MEPACRATSVSPDTATKILELSQRFSQLSGELRAITTHVYDSGMYKTIESEGDAWRGMRRLLDETEHQRILIGILRDELVNRTRPPRNAKAPRPGPPGARPAILKRSRAPYVPTPEKLKINSLLN